MVSSKYTVSFHAVHPSGSIVTALLGDGIPKLLADSGWQVVARPRRVGFTDWQGNSPRAQVIPILLDGYETETSVERQISVLQAWMRVPLGTTGEPHQVRVSGPVLLTNLTWVITSIEPGDEIKRLSDGARVRAAMDVTLTEYISPDVTVRRRPTHAARARHSSTHSNRTYTVRSGDTLSSIAAHQLGDASRWREIATLNNLRDPDSIKVGQVLRLPS
jgi:hypothetical protein